MPFLFMIQGSRKAQGVGANMAAAKKKSLCLAWLEGIELHIQGIEKSEATAIPVSYDKSDDHTPLLFKPLQVFACGHPRLAQVVPSHPGSHTLQKLAMGCSLTPFVPEFACLYSHANTTFLQLLCR